MKILTKSIRFSLNLTDKVRIFLSILILKIKYPKIIISLDNELSKNCLIKCTDNSKIVLKNCSIGRGTTIIADHGGEIHIEDCHIGENCMIVSRNNIKIRKNCQIAEMVVIRDQNHNFGSAGETIAKQGFSTSPVIIEENVWLSAKVTVTAGSHIETNVVVGANAVVRGLLEKNSVYVGVPAKKIKSF